MNREIVKELIQQDMTVENISNELNKLLNDETHRNNIIKDYKELKTKLGGVGASKRIATSMYEHLKN